MIVRQHKTLFPVLFALTIAFILLMALSFWNGYTKNEIVPGIRPFIFLLLALASLTWLFIIQKKTGTAESVEERIKQKVEEERIKILDELGKNQEEKKAAAEQEENIDALVNNMVPKGKFQSQENFAKKLLSNMADEIGLVQGIIYIAEKGKKSFRFLAGYALTSEDPVPGFKPGENLTGQTVQTQEVMIVDDIPESYFNIESGLGKSKPGSLVLIPIVEKKRSIGLLELAIFMEVHDKQRKIFSALNKPVADKLMQIQKS